MTDYEEDYGDAIEPPFVAPEDAGDAIEPLDGDTTFDPNGFSDPSLFVRGESGESSASNQSNCKERRSYGPPGTGKTTYLQQQIGRAAKIYGGQGVLVTSLTKAAAATLVGRHLPIPRDRIGTLHSHCYRVLGKPKIVEVDKELIAEWNSRHSEYAISGGGSTTKDGDAEASDTPLTTQKGDILLARCNIYRSRMIPRPWKEPELEEFFTHWKKFKDTFDVVDFTDLLEITLQTSLCAPGEPKIIYSDESQDMSICETSILRKWSRHESCVGLVLVGDADQAIYNWRGADSDAFINPPLPEGNEKVLEQSYRVPRAVHRVAMEWISGIENRKKIQYFPRDAEGFVGTCNADFTRPAAILRDMEEVLERGESVMLLGACDYHVAPFVNECRKRGVPFENAYRRRRADWNPLADRGSGSTVERVKAFMRGRNSAERTFHDVAMWSELVGSSGVFKRGTKKKLAESAQFVPEQIVADEELREMLDPAAVEAVFNGNLEWLLANAMPARRNLVGFVVKVAGRGPDALSKRPLITVGTIHCSPPDEKILVADGWEIPISELEPWRHRLPSYMEKSNRIMWGKRTGGGYSFEISRRPHDGHLVVISTAKSRTRVTPNHIVPVMFTDDFMEKYVVYLMRRGDWWRVGMCTSAHRPYRAGGVAGRLASEQGDCGWILSVWDTRSQAIMEENKVQATFGIPGLTFESQKSRSLTTQQLHEIYECSKEQVGHRARILLDSYGLLVSHPLYVRTGTGTKQCLRSVFHTAAANILSKYMAVGIVGKINRYDAPEFLACNVERERYCGDVYGIDVPPHHHYFSGGALVHNSTKGGEAHHVWLLPDFSPAAARENDRDSLRRLFYVGMTRARESLHLCRPASANAVKWG